MEVYKQVVEVTKESTLGKQSTLYPSKGAAIGEAVGGQLKNDFNSQLTIPCPEVKKQRTGCACSLIPNFGAQKKVRNGSIIRRTTGDNQPILRNSKLPILHS